jgi:rhodanese-related sulfurtransferase
MIGTITRDEVKAKMDRKEDFLLVEALPRPYYRHTHLPGAINLPPDQVQELAPALLPDKAAEIIVYCASPT